jgi:hypothetical protein
VSGLSSVQIFLLVLLALWWSVVLYFIWRAGEHLLIARRQADRRASANENSPALSTSPDGEQKGADKAQERGGKL